MPEQKMRCAQVFGIAEKSAGDGIQIPRKKVTFTGLWLINAVAEAAMGQPIFPVALNGRPFITHQNHQFIHDLLREVFEPGGIIGMTEYIAKQPDVIKTAREVFGDPDEVL